MTAVYVETRLLGKMSHRRELISILIALALGLIGPLVLANYVPQTSVLPRLMSFSEGAWAAKQRPLDKAVFNELSAPVDIAFDIHGIPHIVAQNDADLFFSQGALTAYFRLFQMDITTRQGMGRLSEMFGEKTLKFDRFFVTLGMRDAIRSEAQELMKDPAVAAAINAYVKGINAYIGQLSYSQLPLEYKLTGTWPELWDAERVAALLKVMTFDLAGRSNDLRLTKILQKLGSDKTGFLFPEFLRPELEEFMIKGNSEHPRSDFDWKFKYVTQLTDFPSFLQPFETNGSNCWAVGPEKSKTGASVLANDTHLGLQMPSVWFEAQLLSPTLNVYGATFPGAPGIVLGFNSNLAWGVTNGTTDVLDWLEVQFKDGQSLEYDESKTASLKQETIHIRGAPDETVNVIKTDYGVIMSRDGAKALAVEWTGHLDSNELKVLFGLAHAKNVDDCIKALRDWSAPIQNFTCADEHNISLVHAGRIPKRESGQGRVVEKADSNSKWKSFIPPEELPQTVNPPSGIVYSANERPADPDYPYYLGWDYEEPFRAQRIRAQLLDKQKLDGPDFIQIQNDILNQHAALALPLFMKYLNASKLSPEEKPVADLMKQWDYFERARSVEPAVFDRWWKKVELSLWHQVKFDDRPWLPKKARTIQFFRDYPSHKEEFVEWIKPHDTLEALVTEAFHSAIVELKERFGEDRGNWLWSNLQPTELPHMARIPGLSIGPITMDGGAYSVQANKGHHGPAWKLVVELGEKPRAWSQIPGGVTGNPLDPEYDKFVDPWSRGQMRAVQFYNDSKNAETGSQYIWHWSRM